MRYFIVLPFLFAVLLAEAQCLQHDQLYHRLLWLRDSASAVAPTARLEELSGYEKNAVACFLPSDSVHALLLQRLGAACYAVRDFVSAVGYTSRSIDMIRISTDQRIKDSYLQKGYSNLSIYYDSLSNTRGTVMAADSCISASHRLGIVNELYLMALMKKIEWLFSVGDYTLCYRYTQLADAAMARYHEHNADQFYFYFLNWSVNLLINDKNYSAAEALLTAALQQQRIPEEYRGTCYEQLGEINTSAGDTMKALSYFQRSIHADRQGKNTSGCIQTLNNEGYYLYQQNLHDLSRAMSLYRQALSFPSADERKEDDVRWELLNVLGNIAVAHAASGNYDSSSYYFERAFRQLPNVPAAAIITKKTVLDRVEQGNARFLIELSIEHADALLSQYRHQGNRAALNRAVSQYQLGDKLLDRFRQMHAETGSKLFWRKNSRRLYDHAIEACWMSHRTDDLFYFFEKSRGVLLQDQLNELSLESDQEMLEASQLQQSIRNMEQQLSNLHQSDSVYLVVSRSLLQNKQYLATKENELRKRNPLYERSTGNNDSGFITINDVQKKILGEDQSLMEFYQSDSALFELVINSHDVRVLRHDRTQTDSLSKRFVSLVSDASKQNQGYEEFISVSHELYNLLFSDIALPDEGRLIISPGELSLPFEALVANVAGSGTEYLLNRVAISYTYSSRFLLAPFNTMSKSSGEFFGVAPVRFPNVYGLPSLPETQTSLSTIANFFTHPKLLTGATATKAAFIENFPDAGVVQLYTHASDSGAANEPVIFFSDSTLYLSELGNRKRPTARLVVLSACNTGKGTYQVGEGMFGFNRGFAALGIPATVSTLWSADEASTSRITELFYKGLRQHMSADVALQQAKREFLMTASLTHQLPFYWAGIVLSGKPEPLRSSSDRLAIYFILLLIAGLFLVVAGYRLTSG